MKFNLVAENFPLKNYDGLAKRMLLTIFLVPVMLLLSYLNIYPVLIILILFASWYLLSVYTRKIMPDWALKVDYIGVLEINENQISISGKKQENFAIEELKSIQVISNAYQGFSAGPRSITLNGVTEIKFAIEENKYKTFRFIIQTKEEYVQLSNLLLTWHERKLPLKEFCTVYKMRARGMEPLGTKMVIK